MLIMVLSFVCYNIISLKVCWLNGKVLDFGYEIVLKIVCLSCVWVGFFFC